MEKRIVEMDVIKLENRMLEEFADNHLQDAIRIITTRYTGIEDYELIYDAVNIVTAMYIKRLRAGECHNNRVLH